MSQPVIGTKPEEKPSEEAIVTPDPASTDAKPASEKMIQQPGWGSAADQTRQAKHDEVKKSCSAGPGPPVSKLLGFPGSVAATEGDPLGWLILVIAGGALAVAGIAFAVRRRRRGSSPTRGPLESVATVVGILGAIAGLAVQFVPGVGAREAPAPAVTMAVSDVNARITHGEYSKKTASKRPPPPEDAREVGSVIWLKIHLEGYRNRDLRLQYALFDRDASGALLPGTAMTVPIATGRADVETLFRPIWVGYPLSKHFEAAFRLLDGGRVQALAATGSMDTTTHRYTCKKKR